MALVLKEPTVGWVKPATPITGLDHLGSAGPCIAIYSTLLPGITNVTDRARYYSFYPWFLWNYEQLKEPLELAHFQETYRRADCLFTLIAEFHSTLTGGDADRHGSRMVGRDTLVPALRDLEAGKSLRLSDFTTQDEKGRRYFKNRLGGLGQYYLATLEDLGILTGRKGQFVQYDPSGGGEIARRFDAGVPGRLFWDVLTRDTVTAKDLKQLAPFCPCDLSKSKAENAWLNDLFFGRLKDDEVSGLRRSRSLALILHLTQAIASDPEATIEPLTFRDACYSGSLPAGDVWDVPEALRSIRDEWRLYQRNELLSVCCQSFLTTFVRSLELLPNRPATATEVAQFLLGAAALRPIAKKPWSTYVAERRKLLPSQGNGADGNHEIAMLQKLFEIDAVRGSMQDLGSAVGCALKVLAALALRTDLADSPPYGQLPIAETWLADYPINLITFGSAVASWAGLSVGEVVEWVMREWACETHLRIALRKLRSEHRDTFRFYPTDLGLQAREVPPFGYSNPRVRQAIQILRDLSALETDHGGRLQITSSGIKWLEAVCRN